MTTARDVMVQIPTVSPEASVRLLGGLLFEQRLDGVCVVDEHDALVGVVTEMDLVFQDRRVHLPTFLTFLDAVIPVGGGTQVEEQLAKMAGTTVAEVMTREPHTVGPDATIEDMATVMTEKHYTILPVVEGGKLLGTVTVRALLKRRLTRA